MPSTVQRQLPPRGRIDIHSHLIPGVDDGCADLAESLACVRQLKAAGFVGSICTSHLYLDMYPQNTVANLRRWTQELQRQLDDAGLHYTLWPGSEVRLHERIVDWMKAQGVPTLAESRCVLVDFWAQQWPAWMGKALEWLLGEGYQPILAHPERLASAANDPATLEEYVRLGVWLQGNYLSITGRDGFAASEIIRRLLDKGLYRLLALDMHRPATLPPRLDGMAQVAAEYGEETVQRLSDEAPRQLVLGL